MRWEGRRESENVEDRRGNSGRRGGSLVVVGGVGTLILVGVALLLGGSPKNLLVKAGQTPAGQAAAASSPEDEKLVHFVKVVLADTEDIWTEQFQAIKKTYVKPKLVIFSSGVRSGCGFADAQVGPFYCPADATVYVDLAFFRELRVRYGSPGDFAEAYVIAHEVGHHVQKLLGLSDQVDASRGRVTETRQNELSVQLELQADFLAGMWARKGQGKFNFLDKGDIEEALHAANAIGDDTLQKQAQGHVVPDSFTHGNARQRVKWFRKGFDSDDIRDGDTFHTREL